MSARLLRGFTVFALAAVLCLVGSSAFAEELPLPADNTVVQAAELPAAQPIPPTGRDLSGELEQHFTPAEADELKAIFGDDPIYVCGAPCGPFSGVNCRQTCGDAAFCYNSAGYSYCMYW